MVLGKLLGLLDLAVLICITLVFFDRSPARIVLWAVFYLGLKFLFFKADFNSYFDLGIAFYVILLIFGLRIGIVYVFILLYLGQKGLLSLV